ncbi:2-C-methyl-D-erythritol 4-phosphate cytidylyltransferase [Acidaminococcus provencensis]|uniref:2-C-methyl-D-erythritol 4-phosphate cytidylyltransferase n=1 Tax=Acidaminococcus provencensis TaxID=2058289 RepID=UPI000CF8A96A|nr:2-C-methyl-D-erythritol 4-phosphate cytidylyltransferase [Acidaminococcus provencensis]
MNQLYIIVAAAGMGKRLGLGYNKNYAHLAGIPILVRNLHQLSQVPGVAQVLVTVAAGEEAQAKELLDHYAAAQYPGLSYTVVTGGKERQDSVSHAVDQLPDAPAWVAVHDGARPFADAQLFSRVWEAARESGAAIAAVPCKDTIKQEAGGQVEKTLDRSKLWAVQTPQIFSLPLLKECYAYAKTHPVAVTDDASLAEALGHPVALVLGSYNNQKITTPSDLAWAEGLVQGKGAENMKFHVGSGYDVHRLVPGRKLILCGVTIPYELGLDGHSDADVALHALMDALLGAAGLGDIGRLYPDQDPAFLGADSRKLLADVVARVKERGWQISNADITIIAQKPKLASYEPAMLANVAADLGLAPEDVNVKATTTEKLGFTGRGEGIAAEAVVSLIQ